MLIAWQVLRNDPLAATDASEHGFDPIELAMRIFIESCG
jgi:hypothetical protein